ncbi:MAG: tonB-system energizer ExbB [Alphaproteobacteria bacterium]
MLIAMPSLGLAQTEPSDPPAPAEALQPADTPPPSDALPLSDDALPADGLAPADALLEAGETGEAESLLPQDLSPWGMFMGADIVVKAVMIGLAFASVVTWTVLIAKGLELAAATRRQRVALAAMNGALTLAEAAERGGTASNVDLIGEAQAELSQSKDALRDRDGIKERIVSRLERLETAAGRRMTKGTGVLATIGATAPFVGLFGTVWGVMNSFIGISKAQTTNLAVVAPGIAEALLATALGLVAAIPAVVFYNHFARRIGAYKALVADTSAAVLRLVSRDLSRGVYGDARREAAE